MRKWLLFLVLIGGMYVYFSRVEVTQITIKDDEIPSAFDGFKIVQLTDLHNKVYGKNNEMLLREITKQSPDIVVMTGDMVSTLDKSTAPFLHIAEQISKSYDTYYIVGNHEQAMPLAARTQLVTDLKKLGITVLDNEHTKIKRKQQEITLSGMWFNLRYYRDISQDNDTLPYHFSLDTMQEVMGEPIHEEGYHILLTHNPVYFETYASFGYDLTLAGHIHGGMIRIPFVGGVVSPERDWFPLYDAGLYQHQDKQMYVSRGLGSGTLKLRLFNRPEMTTLILQK